MSRKICLFFTFLFVIDPFRRKSAIHKRNYYNGRLVVDLVLSKEEKNGIDGAVLVSGERASWGCDYFIVEERSLFPLIPVARGVKLQP